MLKVLSQDAKAVSQDALARARDALSKSRIRDLRRLQLSRDEERVVVSGRVSSFYHQQLAVELLRRELGKVDLLNQMQVEYVADGSDGR